MSWQLLEKDISSYSLGGNLHILNLDGCSLDNLGQCKLVVHLKILRARWLGVFFPNQLDLALAWPLKQRPLCY